MKGITILFKKETTPAQIARFLAEFRLYRGEHWFVDNNNIDMLSNKENWQLILPIDQSFDTGIF